MAAILVLRTLIVISIVLLLVWLNYAEWLGLSGHKLLNVHAFLMPIGFLAMTEALLAFRAPVLSLLGVNTTRTTRKMTHTAFHSVSLVCVVLGLAAVIYEKISSSPAYAHFSSAHTYLGAASAGLFLAQFLVGFVFLLPFSLATRKAVIRFHPLLGQTITTLGLIACVTGFLDIQGIYNYYPMGGLYATETVLAGFCALSFAGVAIALPHALKEAHDRFDAEAAAGKAPSSGAVIAVHTGKTRAAEDAVV